MTTEQIEHYYRNTSFNDSMEYNMIGDLLKEIKVLNQNNEELETLCISWMREYDKLKEKYEPLTLVVSEDA
jgi:iron-sulfur cluster repair protein YtfE (RIC family)